VLHASPGLPIYSPDDALWVAPGPPISHQRLEGPLGNWPVKGPKWLEGGEYPITQETRFFSWGSHACRHASPRCINQHLVVQRRRGVTRTSFTQLNTARTCCGRTS
jgi:hypothetical protein